MPNIAIFKYTEKGLEDEMHEINLVGRKEFTYYATIYNHDNGDTEETLVTAKRLDDGFWSDGYNFQFEVWMLI